MERMMADTPRQPETPEPTLSKTTAPEAAKEKRPGAPSSKDVADQDQMWRTAGPADEATPDENLQRKHERAPDGPLTNKREQSPYGEEAQADALAKQTSARKDQAGIKKPRKQ
jgi:hypothetical protein